ncbi:TPA: cofactor-independent phosphoglycerate mutase [Methanosarcina acetivorans]|uniref:2,3-bisphosphoglycerate-independent phosphoglycerate mutase n=2 Tax=Methanosarcina acetivorans TaxID=2214 RepID=APGM_METAC|nr:cofactor-independent phosphoglycerate mutase [Methanosarcina acetivorans]P58812.1 RecName: Full=2,3-bisphosphoglycerate-independent phosphoglycerate mutase; Short=BPG-independent PGAM; Short=Phosphoglyceromutase; Short=aPGAM [Methanosarcina acetivorans C2A]AAM03586.1 phosphonopyruvate decarboxylase [Methanosarcina acetivorans C2A]HIH95101.1 cofactor-independent phosphoglycerate mutase [Methanosarcina acetivorans]
MKYAVLIGDGMADYPIEELGSRTILQAARTPAMDSIAARGKTGLAKTVPEGFPPGSDVANMSIFGYDPAIYYSGRAPLEAASMGVALAADDVAFRCNLITIENGKIKDYSAGHISSDEAEILIDTLDSELRTEKVRFYPGISYRHLIVAGNDLGAETECTPPHDITGERKDDYLPRGKDGEFFSGLIEASTVVLELHPVNLKRVQEGKNPANSIWVWGQGYAPKFKTFQELYGKSGAIISAVDLLKGIGIYAGLDVIEVPGATGYLDTNYEGKASAAIEALKTRDLVFVHVEAPDEAGHEGSLEKKMKAIEDFDSRIVSPILKHAEASDETFTILVLPDHPTPISVKTHTRDPIPFAIYRTDAADPDGVEYFDEESVKNGSMGLVKASDLIGMLVKV